MFNFLLDRVIVYSVSVLLRFPLAFASIIWIVIMRAIQTVLPQKYLAEIVNIIGKATDFRDPFALVFGPFMKLLVFKLVLTVSFRLWHYLYYYKAQPEINQLIKTDGMEFLLKKSAGYFSEYQSGYLATRLNDMVSGIQDFIDAFFAKAFPYALDIIIPTIYLYTISPVIASCMILPIFVLVGGIWWSQSKLDKYASSYYDSVSRVDGKIVDIFSNILATKFFNTQSYEKKSISKDYVKVIAERRKMHFVYLVMFIVANDIFALVVFLSSSFLAFNQLALAKISGSDFIFIFIQSGMIASEVWMLLFAIPELVTKYQQANYAMEVIQEDKVMPEKARAKDLDLQHGLIEFKAVSFHYPEKEILFSNLNLRIEANQKVALVGSSGSGKSSFVSLIMRLYDTQEGKIKLDGQDVKNVTLDSIYKNIVAIPQNPLLLNRSILENIKYGNFDSSDEEVVEAAKRASIHDFIQTLPKKYKTNVGDLSGGQKQRISIARAFLKVAKLKSRILIVDEATSQIDSITEVAIQDSLKILMQNCTTIIIAHKLSTIKHMDRVLVFDQGHIVEDGSHEELIKRRSTYYRLCEAQSNGVIS